VNRSIQSRWGRLGKVDKTFSVSLVLYLILLVTWPQSILEVLAALATYVLGAWIAIRLLRIGLRKITWRLRNRLIVAQQESLVGIHPEGTKLVEVLCFLAHRYALTNIERS